MALVFDVEESNFEPLVVDRSRHVPVLLDIGADWCGPCLMLTPLLARLVAKYAGQFVLAKVDADENMRIAGRHQAKGFPTVIAYSHGQPVDRFHGMQTEGHLRHFLDKLIAHHAAQSHADPAHEPGQARNSPLSERTPTP